MSKFTKIKIFVINYNLNLLDDLLTVWEGAFGFLLFMSISDFSSDILVYLLIYTYLFVF